MDWWAFSNASSIVWIRSAVYEILADEAFTATDGLISQSFIVAFIHPAYMQIALIWGFPAQLSLWKLVYWLWRYKLNKVCDTLLRTKLLKSYWVYSKSYWVYPKTSWWYLDQQYVNRKESFLLLFLYHHVFPHPLQHFTKQYWDSWKAVARDTVETRRGAVASASTQGRNKVMSGWVYSLEGKEESGEEDPGGSQETESCWGYWSTSNNSEMRC